MSSNSASVPNFLLPGFQIDLHKSICSSPGDDKFLKMQFCAEFLPLMPSTLS